MSNQIPQNLRQVVAVKLGTNFREVTEIVEKPTPALGPKELLVKNRYVGINASDINCTSGRYDPTAKLPFPVGFEGLGEVVAAGQDASTKPGQIVMYGKFGAFSDYIVSRERDCTLANPEVASSERIVVHHALGRKQKPGGNPRVYRLVTWVVDEAVAVPLPVLNPALLALFVSGLTASVSLEKEADLSPNKTVLVTAAAGGTGQFAVQLAKLAGAHVIGTCSSDSKADFLKDIGCDRTVNYNKENLGDVLSKEYPNGVDVVYESVGNEMLDAALKNLAVHGRLIVIGSIANYESSTVNAEMKTSSKVNAPFALLAKSASMRGFFLIHYKNEYHRHVTTLSKLYMEGKLKISTDNGKDSPTGPFVGLEKIADAVEYMYSRKNVGKIFVEINAE